MGIVQALSNETNVRNSSTDIVSIIKLWFSAFIWVYSRQ